MASCARPERLHQLPGREIARAGVANLPRAAQIVERREGLLDRRRLVPAVNLIEVDVFSLQSLQRSIERAYQVDARVSAIVWAGAHRVVAFGREDEPIAFPAQPAPDDLLGATVRLRDARNRIHVGGVDEVDPALGRDVHDRVGRPFVGLGPEGHRPENDARDAHPGASELGDGHRGGDRLHAGLPRRPLAETPAGRNFRSERLRSSNRGVRLFRSVRSSPPGASSIRTQGRPVLLVEPS
jgi:hypothetical protein